MDEETLPLFDLLADEARDSLAATFVNRHRELERCEAVLRQALQVLRDRGFTRHDSICNACLFLNTVDYDLSILIYDLAYERDEWRRRFIARSLALVLYEIAEDLPAVFGKDFRASLQALAAPTALIAGLDVEMKRVWLFWDQRRAMLKEIRTAAAAHRDHDAMRLLDAIDRLDLLSLLSLGVQLGLLLNDLGPAAQAILTYSSGVRPPELLGQSS